MTKKHILIVEDEPAIVQLIQFGLDGQYNFSSATSLAEAHTTLETQVPHLIILDWMLPDGSGIQLLDKLRPNPLYVDLPVIMLTARSGEDDITKGLDSGADDYITKPFSIAELASRIKAILRRTGEIEVYDKLKWEDIHLNIKTREVFYHNTSVMLHRREFSLLHALMKQAGKVLSREQLLNQAWGDEAEIADRAVDVSIRRLRKSFSEAGFNLPISTIRGIGYRLDKNNKYI